MKAFSIDPSLRHATNLNKMEESRLERKTSEIAKKYETKIHDYEEERKELKKKLQDIQTMRNTSPTDTQRLFGHLHSAPGQSFKSRGNGSADRRVVHGGGGDAQPTQKSKLLPRRLDSSTLAQHAASSSVRFNMDNKEQYLHSPSSTPPCSPQFKNTFDWMKMSLSESDPETDYDKNLKSPVNSEAAGNINSALPLTSRHHLIERLDSSGNSSAQSSPFGSPLPTRRRKALHAHAHASPLHSPRGPRRALTPTLSAGAKLIDSNDKWAERPQPRRRALTADSATLLLSRRANKKASASPRPSDLDREVKEIMDKNASRAVQEARSHLRKYGSNRHKTQSISLEYRENSPADFKNTKSRKPVDISAPSTPRRTHRNGHSSFPAVTGSGGKEAARTNTPRAKPPLLRYHSSDNLTSTQHADSRHPSDRDVYSRPSTAGLKSTRARLRRTSSLEDISTLLQKMRPREASKRHHHHHHADDDGNESVISVATTTSTKSRGGPPHPPKGWATIRSKFGFADHTVSRAEERKPVAKLRKVVEQFILKGRTADVMAFNKMKHDNSVDDEESEALSNSLEECRYLRKYVPKFARGENGD